MTIATFRSRSSAYISSNNVSTYIRTYTYTYLPTYLPCLLLYPSCKSALS